MKKPNVSVIINTYNGGDFICDSVQSVLDQTYKNLELIVWDNASTDNTEEIIKKFRDRRIRYFKSKNFYKLYKSRDLAIEQTKGNFVAFLDVDDWWHKKKIEYQINLFRDDNVSIVSCDYQIINQRKYKKKIISYRIKKNFDPINFFLKKYNIGFSTLMIRKSIYTKELSFNKDYEVIGDFDFVLKSLQYHKLANINKVLSYYRWHGDNLSIKKFDINIVELDHWIEKLDTNSLIKKKKNFIYFKDKLNFLKTISSKKNFLIYDCFKFFFNTKNILIKIKIFVIIMLPNYFIDKLRS